MPDREQRIALVGCGLFARNQIQAWRQLPGAELIAVCDQRIEMARAAAELAGGAAVYSDAAEMLANETPDVVDIVTPAPSHLPLAALCAQHATAAIIQKPLAMQLVDAVRIAQLARRARVPMMVHENFRFQKPIRELKTVLGSGAIGEPRYCHIAFRTRYEVFPREPALRRGERLVLMDMGVHVFDVARFLLGEIAAVSCLTQSVSQSPGEDMASALVGFESGATGVVEASAASLLADDPRLQTLITVEGTAGSVALQRDYILAVRSGSDVRTFCAEPDVPAWGARPYHVIQASVIDTCRHWLEFAAGRTALEPSVEDNLQTLAAVEACYRSAAQAGARVVTKAILDEAFAGAGSD